MKAKFLTLIFLLALCGACTHTTCPTYAKEKEKKAEKEASVEVRV